LSINHRRAFPIRPTKVEADAAAIEVASERHRGLAFRRHGIERTRLDRKRLAVNFSAEKIEVELALRAWRVGAAQRFSERGASTDNDSAATARPQEEFHQTFHVALVERNIRACVRQDAGLVARHTTVGTHQHQHEWSRAGGTGAAPAESAVPK